MTTTASCPVIGCYITGPHSHEETTAGPVMHYCPNEPKPYVDHADPVKSQPSAKELAPLNLDPTSEAFEWSAHTKYKELFARVERVLALPRYAGGGNPYRQAWDDALARVIRILNGEE